MYIGKKMKELMECEGVSIKALSEISKIEERSIEAFIDETKEPTLGEFVSIVNALQISPDVLLDDRASGADKKLWELEKRVQGLSEEKQDELKKIIEKFFCPKS